MFDYWTSLNTVTDDEFGEYLSVLETTVEQNLEHLPEHEIRFGYDSFGLGYSDRNQDHNALERAVYSRLQDGLKDVEDKTDLMRYAREQVEGHSSDFSGPFGTFFHLLGTPFRKRQKLILQDIFDEAKRELDRQKFQ